MTVCIAGINQSNPQPYIIAACDRKISFFGGWASAEGLAMKISGLNRNWVAMYSGPTSPMVALMDVISERVKKLKPMNFREFARLCRSVYREERKSLIESDVLGDYDIESYAEYMSLRRTDPQFHSLVSEKVKQKEEDWNLLFAGFDKNRKAHIFAIGEAGKIDFNDAQGYGAIGSGSWRAILALSSYPFKRRTPLSEAVFGIAAAKFSAEGTDGVGEDTILTILEPGTTQSAVFTDSSVNSLRRMWAQLPRFPGNDASAVIWEAIGDFQKFGWLGASKSLKPSFGEKIRGD